MYTYIYIYIHIERERERVPRASCACTVNLCTKILDFRGFDSSRIANLGVTFSCP